MTKRVPGIVLAGIVLTLFHTHPAFSQSSEELNALRNEIEALKQSHSALQKELQELKSLLQSRQAPPVPQNVVSVSLMILSRARKGQRSHSSSFLTTSAPFAPATSPRP